LGSQSGLQGTRPAAAAVLGISPAAELSLLGSQMHPSNRSASHPCSNRVSATSRTAVYGPVCTVVWEGRSCEAPPYPDRWHFSDVARLSGLSPQCGQQRTSTQAASKATPPPQSLWRLRVSNMCLGAEQPAQPLRAMI